MVLETLYKTLQERRRPEDVASLILEILQHDLSERERAVLAKAAGGALRNTFMAYTSMLETFAEPVGAGEQMSTAGELFRVAVPSKEESADPVVIEAFIKRISPEIRKRFGASDFKADRLNRKQRREAGLDLSKRKYNKLFRVLARLEERLFKILGEWKKFEVLNIAKHGLAHHISWQDFSSDLNTACFVAYYTARCNLRSEFTIGGQQRPYDEIADMLFARCNGMPLVSTSVPGLLGLLRAKLVQVPQATQQEQPDTTNWWAIAHVYPQMTVVQKLNDEQKGELLGRWTTILQTIAKHLEVVWQNSNIARDTMIVRRGNDSSTWNAMAGAWNKARDNWMNLIYALGLEEILETVCFGKVLRLMAADVAAWHRISGGGLDPNTMVWRDLPLPWDVFNGRDTCTRQTVHRICAQHGLKPETSGWIAPRPHGVATFRPTPELVHGVSVDNPFLAKVFRGLGYYSGKKATRLNPSDN